jgi:hypothetical protein
MVDTWRDGVLTAINHIRPSLSPVSALAATRPECTRKRCGPSQEFCSRHIDEADGRRQFSEGRSI